MKKLFVILFFAISPQISAQHTAEPAYYLNAERINLEKIYINPQSIDSMHVSRKTENGEIHMFTKEPEFTYLTLDEVVEKHCPEIEADDSIAFKINEKLIVDKTPIRIDDSFFIYTKIDDISTVNYLNETCKEIKILNIDLEVEEREKEIFIRGNGEIQSLLEKIK